MPVIRNQILHARNLPYMSNTGVHQAQQRGHPTGNYRPEPTPEEAIEEKLEEIADQLNKLDELEDISSKLEELERDDVSDKLDVLEAVIQQADVTQEVGGIASSVENLESDLEEVKTEVAELKDKMELNNVMMFNLKAARHNDFAHKNPDWNYEYQLLQKTREGDGVELAVGIFDDRYILSEQELLNIAATGAGIGSSPAYDIGYWQMMFHPQTIDESGLALLVIFYNDDFGIRVQDSLELKRKKWLRWLCT
ncbi:hypothetical protein V5O48_003210 [Marasmius crinis-equi]|uniref:Uncharacterized protein n=1 Tax=Marasmius crinis-equi TaxID=585013 RepID=A0ABR3FTU2_9AGAR